MVAARLDAREPRSWPRRRLRDCERAMVYLALTEAAVVRLVSLERPLAFANRFRRGGNVPAVATNPIRQPRQPTQRACYTRHAKKQITNPSRNKQTQTMETCDASNTQSKSKSFSTATLLGSDRLCHTYSQSGQCPHAPFRRLSVMHSACTALPARGNNPNR